MESLVKGRHLTHAGALYQWNKATPDYLASLPDGGIFEYKLELEGRFYITPPTATLWSWTAGEGVTVEGMSRHPAGHRVHLIIANVRSLLPFACSFLFRHVPLRRSRGADRRAALLRVRAQG